MSGGKGGTQTSSVEIPEYIERAAQRNLNRAEQIAQMGYVPYYGPDVAAFTPMQEAAMQNVAGAAGAFGLATPTGAGITGMPTATEYAGGIRGYSSAPMFEQAQAELARRRPAQKSYLDSFFIDPVTGAYGANAPALVDYTQMGTAADERAAQRANEFAMAALQAGGPSPTYTTYGGHRDVAHDAIKQAMTNYGKQIAAGTAKPEDNPAYNPAIAAANKDRPITFTTTAGTKVTKKAGELTSADFNVASGADQGALAAASMLAAGIRNVGGGSAQDDPTPGFGGALVDMFGGIREDLAGMPGILGGVAGLVDKPDSTYDPTGTTGTPQKKDDGGGPSFHETMVSNAQKQANKFTASKIADYKSGKKVSGF
jgi:hypothetical protein